MCYGVVSGMYLVLLSRRRSSLPIAASRCCPSIPECSTRGGVRLRRNRFRLAAQVSMRDGCGEAVGSSTFSRKPSRSATASRSLSANTGSYMLSLERPGDDSSVRSNARDLSRLTAAAEETVADVGDAHGWRRRRSRSGRSVLLSALQIQSRNAVAQRRMRAAGRGLGLGRCDGWMSLVMLSPAPG